MTSLEQRSVLAGLAILLGACTSSMHGTFVTSSYAENMGDPTATELGVVEGRSCQTRVLYLFAYGDPPTTHRAIEEAKGIYEETKFIADISIDDETQWEIGYAVQCIVVRATAYR